MNIISLGDTCCVAWNKHPGEYYPFDWIKVPRFATINHLLKTDFASLFTDLKFIASSTKFPFNSNELAPFSDWHQQTTHIYSNEDVTFYHDFNEGGGVESVKEKYRRRIERFYQTIKTGNILFIRHQTNMNYICQHDLVEFIDIMDSINPNFQLKIILHNPKNKTISLGVSDVRITILNDTTEFRDWTRPTLDWSKIFGYVTKWENS